MIADIWTMVWKEWKEFPSQRSTLLGMIVFLGIFAVMLPYQRGEAWVELPIGVINLIFVPLFFVLTVIADAFAGERERHTLDTLLASRLSDRTILVGKAAAAVIYGWGMTIAALLISLITASVAAGDGLLLYPLQLGRSAMGFSLLGIILVSGAGILVWLRAATVRQAQQTLNVGLLAIGLLGTVAISVMPAAWREWLLDTIVTASATTLLLSGAVLLVPLDAAILAITVARFRRSRLVLD